MIQHVERVLTLVRTIDRSVTAYQMSARYYTVTGVEADATKALSAGFQVHVGKPIEPTQLVSVVASVTGHGPGPQP